MNGRLDHPITVRYLGHLRKNFKHHLCCKNDVASVQFISQLIQYDPVGARLNASFKALCFEEIVVNTP